MTAERHCERGELLCHIWDTPNRLQFGSSGNSLQASYLHNAGDSNWGTPQSRLVPCWLARTSLQHTEHGFFQLGPGFSSTSHTKETSCKARVAICSSLRISGLFLLKNRRSYRRLRKLRWWLHALTWHDLRTACHVIYMARFYVSFATFIHGSGLRTT